MACANGERMSSGDNSDCLIGEPLDTLQIRVNSKNGVQTHVSALHIGFMETRQYVNFKLPPIIANDTGQKNLNAEEEEWLECMSFLEDDLHWLLKLPYHRFWSQILYDENLHRCLESYLSQAPRDHDISHISAKGEVLHILKQIHKLVFLVYLRMSTYKESKEHHMRPEAFGALIYEDFIFDVPKIMDLCVLYGVRNNTLLSKMVRNIFTTQPRYLDDLSETSRVVMAAFSSVEEKLFMNVPEKHGGCYKLEENTPSGMKELSLSSFCDVVNYITDTSATFNAFLEIYPPACQIFYQNGAAVRIATFYEQVFPALEKEICKLKQLQDSTRLKESIQRNIRLSKTLLIKVFRNILSFCCIQPILNLRCNEGNSKVSRNLPTEEFLEIFMETANEKNFLHDYNILNPFETDLELLNEVDVNLDPERLSYIFCSIYDSPEMLPEKLTSAVENGARPKSKSKKNSPESQMSVKSLHNIAAILKPDNSSTDTESSAFTASNVANNCHNELKIRSLIQSVRDVLPSLGEGFIEICLDHYSYHAEKVIDAILSNNLPTSLNELDRDLERCKKMVENNIAQSSVLAERKSIFDNDEFDVFSRDEINMDKVHIGKKNKTPNSYEVLKNDEESDFLKRLILTYGSEETEYKEEMNIYEDEYDDTYDSVMIGLKEPALEGVPEKEEPADDRRVTERENGVEKETEGELERQARPDDLYINPEILRQRAEERRQSKFAARNRGGRGGASSTNPAYNRQQKDRHKAQASNHNRRKQSDFKKSRGMVPI